MAKRKGLNLNEIKAALKEAKALYLKNYGKEWSVLPKKVPWLYSENQIKLIMQISHIEGVIAALQDERKSK